MPASLSCPSIRPAQIEALGCGEVIIAGIAGIGEHLMPFIDMQDGGAQQGLFLKHSLPFLAPIGAKGHIGLAGADPLDLS